MASGIVYADDPPDDTWEPDDCFIQCEDVRVDNDGVVLPDVAPEARSGPAPPQELLQSACAIARHGPSAAAAAAAAGAQLRVAAAAVAAGVPLRCACPPTTQVSSMQTARAIPHTMPAHALPTAQAVPLATAQAVPAAQAVPTARGWYPAHFYQCGAQGSAAMCGSGAHGYVLPPQVAPQVARPPWWRGQGRRRWRRR